jgi:hypothetical protein
LAGRDIAALRHSPPHARHGHAAFSRREIWCAYPVIQRCGKGWGE